MDVEINLTFDKDMEKKMNHDSHCPKVLLIKVFGMNSSAKYFRRLVCIIKHKESLKKF